MSEERISSVEKEVAILKATQEPLLSQIGENTKANNETQKALVGLTHQIQTLIAVFGDVKDDVEDHESRITTLEMRDAVEQSGRDIKKIVVAGVITILITGSGGFIGYLLQQYFASKGA